MNEQLRDDNTPENCTVDGHDDYPKTGRNHYWQWEEGMHSNVRICTTCGRREDCRREDAPGFSRGVTT